MNQNFVSEISKFVKADGVIVERIKTPSYISIFLGTEDDIILIRKEVQKDKVKYDVAVNESIISENDITGAPLEAPFAQGDDSFDFTMLECEELQGNSSHSPVTLVNARKYLSHCNLYVKPSLPVWIFCNGLDIMNQRALLLGSELNNGWFKRSWAVYKGIEREAPSLNEYCSTHTSISQMSLNSMRFDLMCVCSVSKIMGSKDPSQSYSSTHLQLYWNKLCLNPPLDTSTETVMITKCRIGSGDGSLKFMWNQLCLLEKYVETIEDAHSHGHSSNNTLPSSSFVLESLDNNNFREKETTLSSKLSKIINEPICGYKTPVDSNSSLKMSIDEFTKPYRPGLDLTDKLWYLFMECTTYQELFTCLRQLLEMNRSKTHTLHLRSSNISRLARALTGEAGANILDPLEFLVEIGIEKLKDEILQIFSKIHITSVNSLNLPDLPKFSEVPSSSWVSTVRQWLLWLCRTHCVLELLSNAQTALGLGNNLILPLVPSILKQFLGKDSKVEGIPWLIEKPVQMIKIRIPTEHIVRHVPNHFFQWTLKLTSESNTRKVKSIFHRGLQFPFPNYLLQDEVDNTSLVSTNRAMGYHCSQLHSVEDKFFSNNI